MSTTSRLIVVACACLLVTAAVATSAQFDDAAADDDNVLRSVCLVDSQTNAVRCPNRSLLEVPTGLPANVRTLDLSRNRIAEVTALQIGHLSAVEVISLQDNMLSAIASDAFINCTSLRSLYLDHNVLSSVSFVNRSHVEDLRVSFNRITAMDVGNGVLALTILDLSFNSLRQFNGSTLSSLRNVRMLNLSHNQIKAVVFDDSSALALSSISSFDVSSNGLATFKLCRGCYSYMMQHLNLSSNRLNSVDAGWCELLPNLTALILSHNPIGVIASGTFRHCLSLRTMYLDGLFIRRIDRGMLKGLTRLRMLRLDDNSRLVSLERHAFVDLAELVELDLSGCSLTTIEPETFPFPSSSLRVVELSRNQWHCGCDTVLPLEVSALSDRGVHVGNDTVCVEPASVGGEHVLNVSSERDECRAARPQMPEQTVWAYIGTDLLVSCNATGDQPINITWSWKQNGNVWPIRHADSAVGFERSAERLVLQTGSLYIGSVSRSSAGMYYCTVSNDFGNGTMTVFVRLNTDAISLTTLYSIIVGLLSAAGFFLVAVVIGIARYLAYLCSRKERRKRKSIRAVLESIQDYKCAQFDRFSAYRTAKMDQLSAFKSAKIEQLSAFRDARVDRLRTYKQATVASILTHLERMREHYAAQTARIKENCAQQAERLRQRYTARRGRFKNYRSHQVDKMRENYTAQAARIREYGIVQMSRLREQYKMQQQHVLKLVELLDVGSCVSGVIEAECMKAESMIFDADIAFDFEAQPAHANESLIGDNADVAASDDSDLSLSSEDYSVTCVADVSLQPVSADVETDPDPDDMAGVLAVASDVLRHMELTGQASRCCEDREVSHREAAALADGGPISEAPRHQEPIRGRRSSSDGRVQKQNGDGCMEMAGVNAVDTYTPHQVDGSPAHEDTSC